MALADEAFVYYNPHTIQHKKLENITEQQVFDAFASKNITVFTESKKIIEAIKKVDLNNSVLLMMSSGNFDGINFNDFAKELGV